MTSKSWALPISVWGWHFQSISLPWSVFHVFGKLFHSCHLDINLNDLKSSQRPLQILFNSVWKSLRQKGHFSAYSCVLNTSHTLLGDMPDFLSETCLYYNTCHTILSKTRLEYRTHQLSIDVTMTSFLLWSNKGWVKTRLNLKTWQTFYSKTKLE